MSYDGDFDGDMLKDLEQAVIEAAVKLGEFINYARSNPLYDDRIPADMFELRQLVSVVNNYLAFQKKVGEITEITFDQDDDYIYIPGTDGYKKAGDCEVFLAKKLNKVIVAVNRLKK